MRGLLNEPIMLGFIGLIVVAVAVGIYMLGFSSSARNRRKMRERMKALGNKGKKSAKAAESGGKLRREEGRSGLDKLAARILPNPQVLRNRLEATGKNMSIGMYFLLSLVVAVIVAFLAYKYAPVPPIVTPVLGLAAGLLVPHKLVSRAIAKRQLAFMDQLPEALDLIVRGVKSGLPVAETILSCSQEIDDPIGPEFVRVISDTRIGMTLEEALWGAALRMGLPEFKFFVVTLVVQRETGGNLAETLDNLADLVRNRKQMRLKIKAMASEARASQYILGGLPIAIGCVLALIAPEYIGLLFFTDPGNIVLAVGGTMMSMGWFVMDKMVSFEI